MAKKELDEVVVETPEVPMVPEKIAHVTENFSTEDVVNLAKKVNELVDHLNAL